MSSLNFILGESARRWTNICRWMTYIHKERSSYREPLRVAFLLTKQGAVSLMTGRDLNAARCCWPTNALWIRKVCLGIRRRSGTKKDPLSQQMQLVLSWLFLSPLQHRRGLIKSRKASELLFLVAWVLERESLACAVATCAGRPGGKIILRLALWAE